MEAKLSHTFDTHSIVGMTGTLLSLTLSQINTLVSLGVGLVTLVYMVIKTLRLIKNDAIQQSDTDKG